MSKRKALSKKVRFEVFKRDGFTCQYCGSSAPEVVLVVDHILPVKEGGEKDIMNLITSCQSCNQGKGARKLDDSTALQKQKAQLRELNERREQLEMMLKWRNGLEDLDDQKTDAVIKELEKLTDFTVSEHGLKEIKKWLRKYPLNDILNAVASSVEQYYEEKSKEALEKTFEYIPRICKMNEVYKEKPYLRKLFYIRGIVRNRMYCNDRTCLQLLEEAHLNGMSLCELERLAVNSRNWSQFRDTLGDFVG